MIYCIQNFIIKNIVLFFKIVIFIIFLFFVFIYLSIFKIKKLPKVCICTVAKEENRYIREFIEHYKKYGIDKRFLYDNNNMNGEKFENVISDYIRNKFVEIIDFREIPTPQLKAYNDCYKRNNKLFDWLIFFDIDEFIYLKDFSDIKLFLNDKRFKNCERVQLNWVFHTDNNLIYYENRSVVERFPEWEPNAKGKKIGGNQGIKSILRGRLRNIKIICPHTLSPKPRNCDGFGNLKNITGIITKISDFEYYYIEHYSCKSVEEFIKKINNTDVFHKEDNRIAKINWYLSYNKITKQKIDLIEKATKINLSEYRK